MLDKYSIIKILSEENDSILNSISVSCVIYGFHNGSIYVLLNRFNTNDKWMLPTGFVTRNNDVDDAAREVIKSKTMIDQFYLQQFYLFGDCSRYSAEKDKKLFAEWGICVDDNHWILKRQVTMGYYALVKFNEVKLLEEPNIEETRWFDLSKIPDMFKDHNMILDKSKRMIKREIGYVPLGYELLSDKFTMPELRMIYEAFLGTELDRRNFQRKMLSIGLIQKLEEKKKKGAHKAPYLYCFNREKYEDAIEKGEQLMAWAIFNNK